MTTITAPTIDCEQLSDGVAKPHTKSQLRCIHQLKVKHGIDYGSHASYRFVEGMKTDERNDSKK